MKYDQNTSFPIGYYKFHKDQIFNFQLNRWYSLGYTRFQDIEEVGKRIKTFNDWKTEMVKLAEKAISENRFINAAFYYRSAEFYTFKSDTPKKDFLYDKFIENFYKAYENDNIEKLKVPYSSGFLPVIRVSPVKQKSGTIILHGGFDSFLEEWYLMMKYLANSGYEIIGFEGPGQGAALLKYDLPLDYKWEKPTKAILDYFNLDDVSIFGLSMGGWFCIRAAAFEPRIKRVIASGHAIDYLDIPPPPIAWLFKFFMKYEKLFNRSTYSKMEKNPRLKWEALNLMHITKSQTPLEAAKVTLELSKENIHSEKIKQDVLLLTGRNDHFIPMKMHKKQIEALINAKSITDRIFTKEEQAQNHCQIGNIKLLLDTIISWIKEKT